MTKSKFMAVLFVLLSMFALQGCITSIVTAPVKIAYKATKGVVKGTTKVVKAVIPDRKDNEPN